MHQLILMESRYRLAFSAGYFCQHHHLWSYRRLYPSPWCASNPEMQLIGKALWQVACRWWDGLLEAQLQHQLAGSPHDDVEGPPLRMGHASEPLTRVQCYLPPEASPLTLPKNSSFIAHAMSFTYLKCLIQWF